MNAWLAQCCLYIGLMVIVKTCITLLMQFNFWESVRDFILSPIDNPKVELAFVMLIIPFFVNVSSTFFLYTGINVRKLQILIFWVTDNFLMHRKTRLRPRRGSTEQTLLPKVNLQYRSVNSYNKENAESDILLSGDDDLIDSEEVSHRNVLKPVVA